MSGDSDNLGSEGLAHIELIREYWNKNPFEYQISKSPVGTIDYFRDVELYYKTKYSYLKKYIDYRRFKGKKGLDIGCGFGNDLVILARAGAHVSGVDLSDLAVEMSKKNLEIRNLKAEVTRMDGECLDYEDNSFDFIFAIATFSYTPNPKRLAEEIYRMLKYGGEAYLTVYNVHSWFTIILKALNKKLPREKAPSFKMYSVSELRELLKSFAEVELVTERFPFKTDRDNNIQTVLYNNLFIPAFNLIPKKYLKSRGLHIFAKVVK